MRRRGFSSRRRGFKRMETNYHDSRSHFTNGGTHKVLADYTNATTVAYSNTLSNRPKWLVWQVDTTDELNTYMPITYITQGTSTNDRVGKRILVKKCMFDMNIAITASGSNVPNLASMVVPDHVDVHFALVRHKASAGAVPMNRHLYENADSTSTTLRTTAFRQKNYTSQYEVLKTWTKSIKLDVEVQGADGLNRVAETTRNVKKVVTVNKYVTYLSDFTGGSPSAHQDGGLYLAVWSNVDGSSLTPAIMGMCRTTFIDV